MSDASPSPISPRRRWYQFRLRTLLIMIAIVAVPLAWAAKERGQSRFEQEVALALSEEGIATVVLGDPYEDRDIRSLQKLHDSWRDFARRFPGTRVVRVTMFAADPNDLARLGGLRNLQSLEVQGARIRDFAPLAEHTKLQGLHLCRTEITDLSPLVGMQNLQYLDLSSTKVKDLTPLAALKELKWLNLQQTQVRDLTPLASLANLTYVNARTSLIEKSQVDALQESLPNCKIDYIPW